MSNPPRQIDGANVIEWAWSGDKPFGYIHYEHWETEQDQKYSSINEAKLNIPLQYQSVNAKWQSQK
ncbi:hypothetical protein GTG28_05220 [Vibrio sp. OCN044]|uniref:Uncharacterized protein n=1 Tax=Vibrio tetraodonis subsp. pristinus TaxID=2695891 RepID=A0A6L8LZA9_9VIBR|nr:hypothetical protein [Vibrio tetraodonis]MYM58619.1 hypothetical protein [Vibrio tetraodonis subsp. pristinus]